MGHFHWDAEEANKFTREDASYEDLKTALKQKDLGLKEHHDALGKLQRMEQEITRANREIKEYKEFFAALKKFMPKDPSIFDVLGGHTS